MRRTAAAGEGAAPVAFKVGVQGLQEEKPGVLQCREPGPRARGKQPGSKKCSRRRHRRHQHRSRPGASSAGAPTPTQPRGPSPARPGPWGSLGHGARALPLLARRAPPLRSQLAAWTALFRIFIKRYSDY